ncbi:MAG: DUF1298 domain-containing protein [Burkholderiales bacterium]|nr:DUF1298 domain-containing protein [Burkholderiales bacterium]
MAASILSYRGMAALTVIGDAHLVPDPEVITNQFNREFQKLLKGSARENKKTAAKNAVANKAAIKKPAVKKAATR